MSWFLEPMCGSQNLASTSVQYSDRGWYVMKNLSCTLGLYAIKKNTLQMSIMWMQVLDCPGYFDVGSYDTFCLVWKVLDEASLPTARRFHSPQTLRVWTCQVPLDSSRSSSVRLHPLHLENGNTDFILAELFFFLN